MTDEEKTLAQEDVQEEQEGSEQDELMAKLKEAVTVQKEEVGALRLKLDITVPRDMLDERLGEEFMELKREAVVPGFRKGRAPLQLVQKRFASDVGDQLIAQLVSSGYMAAIEKEGLDPLGDPMVHVHVKEERTTLEGGTQTVEGDKLLPIEEAVEHMKLPAEGSLTFAAEIDLKPEIELPELAGIKLADPEIKVTDEDVDTEVDRIRSLFGSFKAVEEGGAEADDMLYVKAKATVDGNVIDENDNVDLPARDTILFNLRLAGFGEAIMGKKVGEQVSIEVDVPDDYQNLDARGKKATVQITINEIKRLEKVPLDERIFGMLGVENEEELRASLRERLDERVDSVVRNHLHDQVINHLLDKSKIEMPEGLSQRLVEQTIQRRRMEMFRQNTPESEVNKAIDELRTSESERMGRELKQMFILEKIAEDLEVTVGEEEMNAAIAAIAQRQNKRFDRVRDELSVGRGLTTLYLQLRDEAVIDKIIADADVGEAKGESKKGD